MTNEYIVGISGGIDSAVTAALMVKHHGRENVLGVLMPYGEQSTKDSYKLIKQLGIGYEEVDIKPIVDTFSVLGLDKVSLGNVMARVRMTILYSFSNVLNGTVVGTSNKTEYMIGYFTKWGDGAADIEPIIHLLKTEVYELAEELNIPQSIIDKAPSAGLWEGQTDEEEMGLTYNQIDKVLKMIDDSKHKRENASQCLEEEN